MYKPIIRKILHNIFQNNKKVLRNVPEIFQGFIYQIILKFL